VTAAEVSALALFPCAECMHTIILFVLTLNAQSEIMYGLVPYTR
jgi:hypothetical protein